MNSLWHKILTVLLLGIPMASVSWAQTMKSTMNSALGSLDTAQSYSAELLIIEKIDSVEIMKEQVFIAKDTNGYRYESSDLLIIMNDSLLVRVEKKKKTITLTYSRATGLTNLFNINPMILTFSDSEKSFNRDTVNHIERNKMHIDRKKSFAVHVDRNSKHFNEIQFSQRGDYNENTRIYQMENLHLNPSGLSSYFDIEEVVRINRSVSYSLRRKYKDYSFNISL